VDGVLEAAGICAAELLACVEVEATDDETTGVVLACWIEELVTAPTLATFVTAAALLWEDEEDDALEVVLACDDDGRVLACDDDGRVLACDDDGRVPACDDDGIVEAETLLLLVEVDGVTLAGIVLDPAAVLLPCDVELVTTLLLPCEELEDATGVVLTC